MSAHIEANIHLFYVNIRQLLRIIGPPAGVHLTLIGSQRQAAKQLCLYHLQDPRCSPVPLSVEQLKGYMDLPFRRL